MLIGFAVSNFRSFKEVQTFSMVAGRITRHSDHVFEKSNPKLLECGLVFGANASGKSNLMKAVDFSRTIVVRDLSFVNLNKAHFRIDSSMYHKPGIFEYSILVDGIEYNYGIAISYETSMIVGEWLVQMGQEETYIINRYVDDNGISHVETDIDLEDEQNEKLKFYFDGFGMNISNAYKKKTILNDIALRENNSTGVFKQIHDVFVWFTKIVVIFPDSRYLFLNEDATDLSKKQLFSNTLSSLDTGIIGVECDEVNLDLDKLLKKMPDDSIAEQVKQNILGEVSTTKKQFVIGNHVLELYKDDNGNILYNRVFFNHGNDNDLFEYDDESEGTQRLFDLIPLFYKNDEDHLILIDEIDRSLHTMLIRKFFELFYELNKGGQLIATTHDTNLLDLDLFRQDEIWFIERNEDHSSNVYSLNKFKQRFDTSVAKRYLEGRYGAIPSFDGLE